MHLRRYYFETLNNIPEEWIFKDEGYSGSLLVRPGLERLRDLSSEGQIQTIFVYSPDRLSRKYAYQVLLVEEFARNDVEVVFIKSPKATTPEDNLLLQFQGMIAEYERAQIVERSRRGKRYRAKCGSVNVLSGAPYGYRYVKKSENSPAYYEIIEKEAEVLREVFKLYTESDISINGIAKWLNEHKIPTRRGASRWERSTVWGMLRNPAYKGSACYGKTEVAERQKITKSLRQRGGFSHHCRCTRERSRKDWIKIPVPAIVSKEIFTLAEERLEQNKRFSPRRTIEPTLLQGMLICEECGYAIYRTSVRTSMRKIYYYRCIGSDGYRHPNGPVCNKRPIRQDYLDNLVWEQVIKLFENPSLIHDELQRRLKEIQESNPTKRKKDSLKKELIRVEKSIDRLLDAYQENLIQLEELRKRMPVLRNREVVLKSDLYKVETASFDEQAFLRLADNINNFLNRLHTRADTLSVTDRQKIMRLVVKEIIVGQDKIKIKHSIPATESKSPIDLTAGADIQSYPLRSRSHEPIAGKHIPARGVGRMVSKESCVI